MKIIILLLSVLIPFIGFSQAFDWAVGMGGPNYDNSQSIVSDGSGNVYMSGQFRGTSDLDPGPNVVNVTTFSSGYPDRLLLP